MIYENGEVEKSVNVTLNFNDNQEKFLVPYGETKCKLYKFNKNFIYRWEFEYYVPILGGVKMNPDLDSYAKPEFKGIIVKNILFIFTWFGLSLLILEICKFVKFGMKKWTIKQYFMIDCRVQIFVFMLPFFIP